MENLLIEVEKYVSSLLREELAPEFIYHNLGHTQRVVKRTSEIIEGTDIDDESAEDLMLAAWFHDVGYTKGCNEHEESSIVIATEYLKVRDFDSKRLEHVNALIRSTKMGTVPVTLAEKILNDADNSHFGKKGYVEICELLRQEWELLGIKTYSNSEWTEENINFFNNHHKFYTEYALENWQQTKDKNLANLYKVLKKQKQEESKSETKAAELAFKKKKAKLPERGIETMFRVTLKNHIELSNIADTKANILLSVNAIIVSLVLSNLVSKLDNESNTYLIWPTVIFVLFTVISMILSVLATRPNVTSGKFTKEDVKNKKVNLIFFGNFHKMELNDFEWAMGEMMQDREYLYSSMKKDLYFLGKVLNRKYKILRVTYTVFMIGIIVSVISFAIAFVWGGGM